MKRGAGQAGLLLLLLLHRFGLLLLTLLSVLIIAFCLLAFRLSLGPLQIPYLASVLATAVSGQGVSIHIGQAALAWAGYRQGGGEPLYLQLDQVTAANAAGVALAEIPHARLVFLPSALLGGGAPILVNSSDMRFAGAAAPVSLRAALRLGFGFHLAAADLLVSLGPGTVAAAGMDVPVAGGGFAVHLTPRDVSVRDGEVDLAAVGASHPVLLFAGSGKRQAGGWQGGLTLRADRVQAADLPAYWPAGLAAQTRHWVTGNITAGTAHDAVFTFTLAAPANLAKISLQAATGGFAAEGVTLGWIPQARPITGLAGRLTLVDRDTVLITADTARLGGLLLHDGTMKITGVSHKDQIAVLNVPITGGIGDALAILAAPPLHMLGGVAPQMAKMTGTVTATVAATMPLQSKVALADVTLDASARLSDAAGPTPLDGVAFTAGAVRLRASTTALTLNGTAQLGGQPAVLAAQVDFRSTQPLRHLLVTGALGPAALLQLGLANERGLTDQVQGALPVTLEVKAGAGDTATARLRADLTPAELGVPVLGWGKTAGTAGTLTLGIRLRQDQFAGINDLDAAAPGLAIHGSAQGGGLHLLTLRIGGTSAVGDVLPPQGSGPWQIRLQGARLDVRAILSPAKGPAKGPAKAAPPASTAPPAGPAWQAVLSFATVNLAAAPAPALHGLQVNAAGKGAAVLRADVQAVEPAGQAVSLAIAPVSADGARRSFHLAAGDAGTLLRALAAYDDLQNGALLVAGTYGAGDAFTGTVTLNKFRLLHAPAIGKVLQAVTIYGAGEAASGPGLEFDRAVAPFSIARQKLTLTEARAYSAALGFTASGVIGLADGDVDLDATIIPAYALNTLPGKIPVIGRLFSAETGGGLISLRARITGQLSDPKLFINPLSALTPGALRGVFGAAPK